MRKFLFGSVANSCYTVIRVVDFVLHWSLAIQLWLGGWFKKLLASMAVLSMQLIDNERLEYNIKAAAEAEETANSNRELQLMKAAIQLRDHAAELGDWTEEHTMALNAVGEALLVEAGWDEVHVHNYLKGVVEAIPGLEYGDDSGDMLD